MRSTFPATVALMVLSLTAAAADDFDQSLITPNKKAQPIAADGNSFQAASSPSKKYIPPRTTIDQSPGELRAHLESMLNNGAISLDFTGQPLNEVMDFIHDKFPELSFQFDSGSLKDAGIDPVTTLVTIKLNEVRLKTALHLMLGQFNLDYYIHDGVPIIATKETADARLETRIYDCHEILSADNDQFRRAFGKNRSDSPAGSAAKKSTAIPQSNKDASSANENTTVKSAAIYYGIEENNTPSGNLIEVITNSVRPQSWTVQGGPGSIYEYSGLLIVNQTYEAHTQLTDLLEKLSAKLKMQEKN